MVLLLNSTDTVEEFEDRIMQKKMKIPKMSIKNSGNSFDNCYGEERMPLRHKKVGCGQINTTSVLIRKVFIIHLVTNFALFFPSHLYLYFQQLIAIITAYVETDLLCTHT